MSVTIEEVMQLVREYGHEVWLKGVAESDYSDVRAALSALVAQARDEEAESLRQEIERYVLTGLMACDANGNPCAEYISREQVDIVIRARIAGRKDGGART